MQPNRRAGLRSRRAKAATWLLGLVLFVSACQPAPPTQALVSPQPGQVTEPTAATIRTELHATDPASVNLASGKPTLVEFFAFW